MTTTGPKDPGHNLKGNAIKISDVGLTTAFESDKTTTFYDCVKRCTRVWDRLPTCAKEVIQQYKNTRPVESDFFFCKKDGCALTRDEFINLLDVCFLQTVWAMLTMTPHKLRQG